MGYTAPNEEYLCSVMHPPRGWYRAKTIQNKIHHGSMARRNQVSSFRFGKRRCCAFAVVVDDENDLLLCMFLFISETPHGTRKLLSGHLRGLYRKSLKYSRYGAFCGYATDIVRYRQKFMNRIMSNRQQAALGGIRIVAPSINRRAVNTRLGSVLVTLHEESSDVPNEGHLSLRSVAFVVSYPGLLRRLLIGYAFQMTSPVNRSDLRLRSRYGRRKHSHLRSRFPVHHLRQHRMHQMAIYSTPSQATKVVPFQPSDGHRL